MMDSGEEVDFALTVPENPSSPFSKPKLKRLKKVASFPSPPLSASFSELPVVPPSTLTLPNTHDPIGSGIHLSDAIRDETLDQQKLPEPNLDPLFSFPGLNGSIDALDGVGSEGKFGGRQDETTLEDTRKQKSVKRKLSLDAQEEDAHRRKDKKDRSRKRAGQNGKPTASIRKKRALEKERKVELENLHAESQRLLRETRDASFKPVKLVQKPISSVLDKIRQRKLEILKSIQYPETTNSEPTNGQINVDQNYENDQLLSDIGSKTAYLNHANDAREDEWDYQLKNGRANLASDLKTSFHSRMPASIFKFNAAGITDGIDALDNDDVLSTEDESDKENIGPSHFYIDKMDLSSKKPLGKAFVDDEAEESDDSDYDLLRSQEDDESDTDGQEELDDLIDKGYSEAPIDQEQRDELHQKWLEQQDVVETDNVLQRLKYAQGRGHLAFLHDYYSDKDEEDSENDSRDNVGDDKYDSDVDDKIEYKHHPTDTTRQIFKKAKQMIAQMFSDVNDVYVPSDDEEIEKSLMRHHILKKQEEPSFAARMEDENSREVYGLIKKLNIAPGTKKIVKASTSVFDSLVSGSSNSSSKSSFLNRASNSLPACHRQGSISVKAFIFGRDDSNSRNSYSTSENIANVAQKESSSRNDVTNKSNNPQRKTSTAKTMVQPGTQATSLFDILRQSSKQFDQKLESKGYANSPVVTETQAAYQFSAFKVRRPAKMNS